VNLRPKPNVGGWLHLPGLGIDYGSPAAEPAESTRCGRLVLVRFLVRDANPLRITCPWCIELLAREVERSLVRLYGRQ